MGICPVVAALMACILIFAAPTLATKEYARQTGQACSACHRDPSGGGELTEAGHAFQAERVISPVSRPMTPGLRVFRFAVGYLHLITAILCFGTILYVHLVLKPAYAVRGLPPTEVRLGVALSLFALQVLVGTWLAVNYWASLPQGLVNVFPFSTARAIHTNLLVLWLLLGFMGSTYYPLPDETGRELYSPRLAYVQLAILAGTGVTGIVGFLFGWTKGKPLLELPTPLAVLIVIGALIFLFNVGMTMFLARKGFCVHIR